MFHQHLHNVQHHGELTEQHHSVPLEEERKVGLLRTQSALQLHAPQTRVGAVVFTLFLCEASSFVRWWNLPESRRRFFSSW